MFAFALWDTVTGELFCARDPFGIKPLFMATGTGGTAVASEKKCLLDLAGLVGFEAGAAGIDYRAVQHYTVLQYVPEPETLHRGVRRLESGCYARIRPGRRRQITRYFVPRFAATPITRDTEQARYDEITAVLEDSVAKHMRADVTVGAFLSGGIDSTAIAALAIRHNPRLITFTTGFEREGFSEIDVAVASAEAIGARHIAKVVSPDEFVAALPEIVWYLDEPVADPALVPLFFVAREARKHVKVVLSGEGADELFGGYTIYREPLSLKPFDYLPRPLRRSVGKVSKPLPEGMRGKSLLHRGSLTLEERYYGNARSFSDAQLRDVLPGFRDGLDPHRCDRIGVRRIDRLGPGGPHAARRPVHLAARRHPGQGRQDDDGQLAGASGAVPGSRGVRRRVPVAGLREDHPHHHQVRAAARPGAHRAGARAAPAQARVPGTHPALAARRRTDGVGVRDGGLVAGQYQVDLIDLAAVRRMLDEHRSGTSDHSRRLWTVLIFMLWHAIFVEHSVVPQISEPQYPVQLLSEPLAACQRLRAQLGQHRGDLGGRVLAVGAGQPGLGDLVVPLPLLGSSRFQHQHGDQRAQLRRTLQAQTRSCARSGSRPGRRRRRRWGRPCWSRAPRRRGWCCRRGPRCRRLGAERGHPQVDLRQHVGLRPAGLGQQQVPFVVVGEQVGGAVDQLADLFAGQAGPAAGTGRRRTPSRACGTPRCAPPWRPGRWRR